MTPALIVALVAGFAFFNEVLFWTLGISMTHDGHPVPALLFGRVSAGLGALVWCILVIAMARAAVHAWTDVVIATATLSGLAAAAASTRPAGWEVVVNAALGLWLARGWGKQ